MADQSPDFQKIRDDQREFWNRSAPAWKQMFVALDSAGNVKTDDWYSPFRLRVALRGSPSARVDGACDAPAEALLAPSGSGAGGERRWR